MGGWPGGGGIEELDNKVNSVQLQLQLPILELSLAKGKDIE